MSSSTAKAPSPFSELAGLKRRWSLLSTHFARAFRNGRVLGVTVFEEPAKKLWHVFGVEGPTNGDVNAVLEDHGHRSAGSRKTLRGALRLAERFMERWERGEPIELCACEEIPSKPASEKRPMPGLTKAQRKRALA